MKDNEMNKKRDREHKKRVMKEIQENKYSIHGNLKNAQTRRMYQPYLFVKKTIGKNYTHLKRIIGKG